DQTRPSGSGPWKGSSCPSSAGRRCRPREPSPTVLLLLELPLQRSEGAVLKRLDRAFGLVEDRRRLRTREIEDELQREDLLLLVRELPDHFEHALAPDRLERLILCCAPVARVRLGNLL